MRQRLFKGWHWPLSKRVAVRIKLLYLFVGIGITPSYVCLNLGPLKVFYYYV